MNNNGFERVPPCNEMVTHVWVPYDFNMEVERVVTVKCVHCGEIRDIYNE